MKSHQHKDMKCTCGQNEKCAMHDASCKECSCGKEKSPYMKHEHKHGDHNHHCHCQEHEHSDNHKK